MNFIHPKSPNANSRSDVYLTNFQGFQLYLLPSASCLLPPAFLLYKVFNSTSCLLPPAFCLLPSSLPSNTISSSLNRSQSPLAA